MSPKLDIDAAVEAALLELERWFLVETRREIETSKWPFATPPRVRDIVDTGRLRDSVVVTRTVTGGFSVTWNVDYATSVHEGGVDPETGARYEGRPWTRDVIARIPSVFTQFLKTALTEQAVQLSNRRRTR